MANEKVNKVVLGNETLIDLTGDTVSANNLLAGATAHDNRGEQIQGEVVVPEELNDLDDVDNISPQEGDVLVSDENGVYQNKHKSLYPSAPKISWAEYQQLVDDEEDDPDAEYYIDDIDVAEAYYVETSGQTALTGATSLTFTNSHIKPTADIRILAEPASCKVATNPQYKVSAKLSSVGNGTATITFPALAENTKFWLLIECPLAITQNDETKADKIDLASINVIGSTNTTGSTISAGTYFYLNGLLVRAKINIATNATFTLNTNYEVVTTGALNELRYVYSTTEHFTGRYWVDGRKIYEKSFVELSVPRTGQYSGADYYYTRVSMPNLDRVLSYKGYMVITRSTTPDIQSFPLGETQINGNGNVQFTSTCDAVAADNVDLMCQFIPAMMVTSCKATFSIEYVKTSD